MRIKAKRVLALLVSIIMIFTVIVGCSSTAEPTQAEEEEFKFERNVEFIVCFGPGSGNDQTMRALAPLVEKIIGVDCVVTNIEGGGGLIGMEYAYRQPADGYTYLLHSPTHLVLSLQDLSEVDMYEHFQPVAKVIEECAMIVGRGDSPYKTWDDLYEYAKANPNQLTIGGQGPTGVDAIAVNLMLRSTGLDMRYVSFDGGAEVRSALLGGHIDLVLDDPSSAIEMVKSGDMNAYVVLADNRLPALPDVPCSVELGYDVTFGPLRAIAARKGTPEGALEAMEAAIKEATETEEWKEMLKLGMQDQKPGFGTSEELKQIWDELGEVLPGMLEKK